MTSGPRSLDLFSLLYSWTTLNHICSSILLAFLYTKNHCKLGHLQGRRERVAATVVEKVRPGSHLVNRGGLMLLQRQGTPLARTRRIGGAPQPHPLGPKLPSGQSLLHAPNKLNIELQSSPSTSRVVQCHSSHTHAARSTEESAQFDNGVVLVFKKWARTLSLLGALAAWSYLSNNGNTNSPFASISLSIPSTSGEPDRQAGS